MDEPSIRPLAHPQRSSTCRSSDIKIHQDSPIYHPPIPRFPHLSSPIYHPQSIIPNLSLLLSLLTILTNHPYHPQQSRADGAQLWPVRRRLWVPSLGLALGLALLGWALGPLALLLPLLQLGMLALEAVGGWPPWLVIYVDYVVMVS